MKNINKQIQGEELFAGIDLHKRRWHVTIRTVDVEIFSSSIVGRWEDLRRILNRYLNSSRRLPQYGCCLISNPMTYCYSSCYGTQF